MHSYWREVFLVKGGLTVGNDEHSNGGSPFKSYTYAARPPGTWHNPFKPNGGCMLLKIHYYGLA